MTLLFPIGIPHAIVKTRFIPEGHLGLTINGGKGEFLRPGKHFLCSPFRKWVEIVNVSEIDEKKQGAHAVLSRGFVTVLDGYVGIASNLGQYILLGISRLQTNCVCAACAACELCTHIQR